MGVLATLFLALVVALVLWGRPSADDSGEAPTTPQEDVAPTRFVLATFWSPAAGWERTRGFMDCIEAELGGPVELLQRESYDEANALLASGGGDFGLICSGATADESLHEDFVPAWRLVSDEDGGRYRGTILVRREDEAQTLEDLRGSSFAWVDPKSLSGYYALRAELRRRGEDPGRFFGDVRFTYSHDRSIEAVQSGVVRAAVVDEVFVRQMVAGEEVRAIWYSEYFPSPVFLVRKDRPDLAGALERLASRRECLAPLGAVGLEIARWEDYRGVIETVALAR